MAKITIEDVVTRLAESRRILHQAIQGLSTEEMTQIQVEGVWTIKDILGHITSWEEICLEPLRRYAQGNPFRAEVVQDELSWNDQQAARKREIPLNVILDELTAIRQPLVAAASQLSASQQAQVLILPWGAKGTVAKALAGLAEHEIEHAHHIQAWRRD